MGFGSYDESEQENQQINTDFDEGEGLNTSESDHEGHVKFDIGASNDELLNQLRDMKDEEDEDEAEEA